MCGGKSHKSIRMEYLAGGVGLPGDLPAGTGLLEEEERERGMTVGRGVGGHNTQTDR